MSFIKRGDAQPITSIYVPATDEEEEKTKKALEEAKQAAKNIEEDGNKTLSKIESK